MTAGDILVISEEAGGRKGTYYDGTDDYTLIDAHAVAAEARADTVGTYTAWIYLDNITGNFTVLSAGDNSSANEQIVFDSVAGKLRTFLKNGAAATQFLIIETTAGLKAREWMHVAVRQNGTRPDLFINGVKSAMTDTTSLDLTPWYADVGVGPVDKFAIGVTESNTAHTNDLKGAIGQVKYWALDLQDEEILNDFKGITQPRATILDAALYLNLNMDDDGVTDSGLDASTGVLTGHAYYGGTISNWSYRLNYDALITGHAAEFMNTFIDGSKYVTIIKKGD